ncbi:uncharacterized protein [Temnothorax nylanderi]|uniref:uncharacterized protein n=1 Tax=Temnothorax nylanderi TaxID=102681 RepID=UPI003A8A0522
MALPQLKRIYGVLALLNKERQKVENFEDVSNCVYQKNLREAIGSLMFLMVATRPDLAYIVSVLSQFSEMPDESHWNGIKRIFRYLKGTIDHGIVFGQFKDNNLVAYSDSDWAGDVNTRKSTTGWLCLLNGGPVAWLSRKQSSIALSATEAEFIALCSVTKEVTWSRRLLNELGYQQLADSLTKALCKQKLVNLMNQCGMKDMS